MDDSDRDQVVTWGEWLLLLEGFLQLFVAILLYVVAFRWYSQGDTKTASLAIILGMILVKPSLRPGANSR